MRRSLTNTQRRTASISRSHYKPFARIGQRVFDKTTMNTSLDQNDTLNQYAAFIAIDWADQKHVFSLQVAGQTKKETGELEQKPEVIGPWVAKLRQRFGGRAVAVGLEQSRGALIHALMTYDFLVIYPLHPTTVSKYREAFKSSGVKSDPLDTDQILQILTKHLELLRPLNPETQETRLLTRLVEDRRSLVNVRTSHVQALIAALKEHFPQTIELVSGDLTTSFACDFVLKWPTFQAFLHAKPSKIRDFFYGHNVRSPEVIERALGFAKLAKALTTDPAVVESSARKSQALAQMIKNLNLIIDGYDQRIEEVFEAHPEAYLFNQLPGAGQVMAPRLLSFFGSDRSRYEAASNVQSYSGIAPVTKSSGKSRSVYMRRACPKFDRQTFHEFARLSLAKCQWARNYLDYYNDKGKKLHTIVRALAFKWIRILFRCWKDQKPYDEAKYMQTLTKRGSIFATLHLKKIS